MPGNSASVARDPRAISPVHGEHRYALSEDERLFGDAILHHLNRAGTRRDSTVGGQRIQTKVRARSRTSAVTARHRWLRLVQPGEIVIIGEDMRIGEYRPRVLQRPGPEPPRDSPVTARHGRTYGQADRHRAGPAIRQEQSQRHLHRPCRFRLTLAKRLQLVAQRWIGGCQIGNRVQRRVGGTCFAVVTERPWASARSTLKGIFAAQIARGMASPNTGTSRRHHARQVRSALRRLVSPANRDQRPVRQVGHVVR